MTIYILLKETYGFEGATEAQEITAYHNKEDALKIKNAYTAYREQIEALEFEYNHINLRYHPEWNGQIGKLRKANREKYYALLNQELNKWDYMSVEAVEVK